MEESFLMQSIGNALYWTKAIYPMDPNADKEILENGELMLSLHLRSAIVSAFNWEPDFSVYGKDQDEALTNLTEFLAWIRHMCSLKNLEHFVDLELKTFKNELTVM